MGIAFNGHRLSSGHRVHVIGANQWLAALASRSSSMCSSMDEASHLDDDDDSIADRGRRVGIDVDDSE